MGRPLKIKKSTTKDIGFNMWSELTTPVFPATFTTSQFAGVVGGAKSVASSSYPVVKCVAFISDDSTYRDAFILRQKGTTKYMVAAVNAINDEDMVVGNTYYIVSVGTTTWKACGAPSNAGVGDTFTCTAAGSGTGTVYLVGTCALVNDTTPASGEMSITMNVNADSTEIGISKLTNKFALDYTVPPVRYAINFFTDDGSEIKSGTQNIGNTATQQNILSLGQILQYTS